MKNLGFYYEDLHLSRTFTVWSLNHVLLWRNESSCCPDRVRRVLVEPVFVLIGLIGVVETVVRAVLALLVKPVDLFVSEESCIADLSHYLINTTSIAALGVMFAMFECIANWYSPEDEERNTEIIRRDYYKNYQDVILPLIEYKCECETGEEYE